MSIRDGAGAVPGRRWRLATWGGAELIQPKPTGAGQMQPLQQVPLAALAHQGAQGLEAGEETDAIGGQGRQGLQVQPFVFEADGQALLGQQPGGGGIAHIGPHHAAGQGHGADMGVWGLQPQRYPSSPGPPGALPH